MSSTPQSLVIPRKCPCIAIIGHRDDAWASYRVNHWEESISYTWKRMAIKKMGPYVPGESRTMVYSRNRAWVDLYIVENGTDLWLRIRNTDLKRLIDMD